MDFDIGNLIYIIATLVAILIGILGKRKKKGPAADPGSSSSEGSGNLFDKIGQELEGFMESKQPDAMESVSYEPIEEPVAEVISEDPTEYENPVFRESESMSSSNEGSFDANRMSILDLMDTEAVSTADELQVIDLDEEEEEGADYFEIIEKFDLTTAVIYAEIINKRPI